MIEVYDKLIKEINNDLKLQEESSSTTAEDRSLERQEESSSTTAEDRSLERRRLNAQIAHYKDLQDKAKGLFDIYKGFKWDYRVSGGFEHLCRLTRFRPQIHARSNSGYAGTILRLSFLNILLAPMVGGKEGPPQTPERASRVNRCNMSRSLLVARQGASIDHWNPLFMQCRRMQCRCKNSTEEQNQREKECNPCTCFLCMQGTEEQRKREEEWKQKEYDKHDRNMKEQKQREEEWKRKEKEHIRNIEEQQQREEEVAA